MSWAKTCYDSIGQYISKYSKEYGIPEHWVAGLISVECARLSPITFRFEKHVFDSVMHVKNGKKSSSFPGFNSGKIKKFIDATDDQNKLKMLATSYGYGQLMGYHYVNKYDFTVDSSPNFDRLTPELSVLYTIKFMAGGYIYARIDGSYSDKEFERLLRWHNTGGVNGKTYHDNYVLNAIKMSGEYEKLLTAMASADILKEMNTKPSDSKYDEIVKQIKALEDRVETLEKIVHG